MQKACCFGTDSRDMDYFAVVGRSGNFTAYVVHCVRLPVGHNSRSVGGCSHPPTRGEGMEEPSGAMLMMEQGVAEASVIPLDKTPVPPSGKALHHGQPVRLQQPCSHAPDYVISMGQTETVLMQQGQPKRWRE